MAQTKAWRYDLIPGVLASKVFPRGYVTTSNGDSLSQGEIRRMVRARCVVF